MEAEDLGGAVVDDEEEVDAPFAGHRLGHVRSPDRVHAIRHDGAVVAALGAGPPPVRSLQAVFRDEPPHAPLGGADAPHPQARMDLPIALAAEVGAMDDVEEVREQVRVAASSLRLPSACGWASSGLPLSMAVERAPRPFSDAADPADAVGPVCGGRERLAHFLDLRIAKGRPSSNLAIFSSRSSASMVI